MIFIYEYFYKYGRTICVKINGFIIESGKGSGITDGVTGQYSRVGGAIFAYLSVPQVNNCIFKGGDENQLGNLIYYTPDPDDIIYPATKRSSHQ